jgi:2-oxoglutarate dehydrogenase complex dehydrogenase (E1) component-like enzyme
VLGAAGAAALAAKFAAQLDAELGAARGGGGGGASPGAPCTPAGGAVGAGAAGAVVADGSAFAGLWTALRPATAAALLESPATGAPAAALRAAARASVATPPGFAVHDRLARGHVAARRAAADAAPDARVIDWATAEAMAFGALAADGVTVRLSGQDAERGTFSHRHAVLVDQVTEARWAAFAERTPAGGSLAVHSSLLSEEAVLGFEYGHALHSPRSLTLWEAQFGDFANAAQTVIDTFVATGESKWLRSVNLVLLLPHGQDGAGPEHSSARLERFLQLCNGAAWAGPRAAVGADKARDEPLNLLVAQPTTPANYFHLLRRQVARDFRKPLVVAAPKALLRTAEAASALDELAPGTRFQPVLGEAARGAAADAAVRRVVLCSGKIFYELDAARRAAPPAAAAKVALVRVEELAPWPAARVAAELARYGGAADVVWAQEEPANAGAWAWARMHLPAGVTFVGRPALATAAVGLKNRNAAMQKEVIAAALAVA